MWSDNFLYFSVIRRADENFTTFDRWATVTDRRNSNRKPSLDQYESYYEGDSDNNQLGD